MQQVGEQESVMLNIEEQSIQDASKSNNPKLSMMLYRISNLKTAIPGSAHVPR